MSEAERRILDKIDRLLQLLIDRFDSSLLSGILEDELLELYHLMSLIDHPRASTVMLLHDYARALRARVVLTGSRRGLSRARDEMVVSLTAIMAEMRGRNTSTARLVVSAD